LANPRGGATTRPRGSKELCVRLNDTLDGRLYVENHRYRGGDYDVYTTDSDDDWTTSASTRRRQP
jgi:hypothetical protein